MACSCSTDHLCDEPCQAKCEGQICDKKAGHTGDHICKKLDHKCTATC